MKPGHVILIFPSIVFFTENLFSTSIRLSTCVSFYFAVSIHTPIINLLMSFSFCPILISVFYLLPSLPSQTLQLLLFPQIARRVTSPALTMHDSPVRSYRMRRRCGRLPQSSCPLLREKEGIYSMSLDKA